jgi:hypothetical protein
MSKQNKANKGNYAQAGRLSQDDMARERVRQAEVSAHAKGKENITGHAQERDRDFAAQESSRPKSAPEE